MQEIKLYNNKVTILFNEERHIYFEGKKKLPGVTSITGVVDKSGALMGWTAKMMSLYLNTELKNGTQITEDVIERAKREYRRLKTEAADIGTEIHKWAEDWINGKKPEMPDDERVVNGITAFLKFQKEHKIKWLETERLIYSKKHKYAGKLDAIGIMDGKLTLIDFKSSTGIYDEMLFQVAGYKKAFEEETGKKVEQSIIVKFGKETGDFEVKVIEDMEKNEKAFLACLALYNRLKELKC